MTLSATRPSHRTAWALADHRVYFTIQDRQSDVRLMDIAQGR